MDYAWKVIGTVERAGLETRTFEFVVATTMESAEAAEGAALRHLVSNGVARPHENAKDQTVKVTIDLLELVGPVPRSTESSRLSPKRDD